MGNNNLTGSVGSANCIEKQQITESANIVGDKLTKLKIILDEIDNKLFATGSKTCEATNVSKTEIVPCIEAIINEISNIASGLLDVANSIIEKL